LSGLLFLTFLSKNVDYFAIILYNIIELMAPLPRTGENHTMKILLLHDIQADKQNGVSVSMGILYRELKKLGYDIKILTLSDSTKSHKDGDSYCMSSVPALVYPGIRMRPIPKSKYIKELIEWNPDVIHTNCEFSTFLVAKKIKNKCRKTPVWVHTFHTDYQYYIGVFQKIRTVRDKMVPKFLNSCFKRTDALIVPTEKINEYVHTQYFSDKLNVKIIPTGIDFSELVQNPEDSVAKTKQELGIPEDGKMVLFLGRISSEKNLGELVDNFKEYCKVRDNVYLVTVGDGPYRDTLLKRAKEPEFGGRLVVYKGVPHKQIRRFYDAADAFASASVSETQGLTFYEALYCNVPVLAKDRYCLEDAISEGVNGAFFTDTKSFIAALNSIIDLKSQSADTKPALPECFESECFAKAVAKLYDELLVK